MATRTESLTLWSVLYTSGSGRTKVGSPFDEEDEVVVVVVEVQSDADRL
jgi:hypothetical protein